MARLTLGAFELNRCDEGTIVIDLVDGFDDEPEVKGRDLIPLGVEGRFTTNRLLDRRILRLRGMVQGVGATAEERAESYRDLIDGLHGAFDPTILQTLTVYAPYLGLASGSRSLDEVRFINAVWGPFLGTSDGKYARVVDAELESVASPPDWTSDSS